MAVLRELHGEREFRLRDKITLIGRSPACDLVLSKDQVSGRHALILSSCGSYFLEDLGSRNGTALNGRRIQHRVRLRSHDRIEFPGVSFIFEEDQSEEPAAEEPADKAALADIASTIDVAHALRVEVKPEAKLSALLEISRNLSTALDLKAVLPKILESLFTIFPQADRGYVLLCDPVSGRLIPQAIRHRHKPDSDELAISRAILKHALSTGKAILSSDAGRDQRFAAAQSIANFHIRSVMCVPLLGHKGDRLGAIQIDTQDRHHPFSTDDLDVLLIAALQAARTLELTQLHQEQRELEAATQIQKSFLPAERPKVPGLEFFDYYSAARHVGGDYFDYIPLPGNRLAVALGDVSGHGVAAALLMARLSAAARFCLASEPSLAAAVRRLSAVLTRTGTEDRFVTCVVGVIDLSRFSLTLVNAGHLPPLRRRRGQDGVELLGEAIAGLPLAVLDRPYEELEIMLEPGDTLVLYTDGISEARAPGGELYGNERLTAVVRQAPNTPEGLGQAILADVRRFAGEGPQRDDLTLVCFGRKP
jgi:serine phosphatase RsbU (regulator of sigma subunit)